MGERGNGGAGGQAGEESGERPEGKCGRPDSAPLINRKALVSDENWPKNAAEFPRAWCPGVPEQWSARLIISKRLPGDEKSQLW